MNKIRAAAVAASIAVAAPVAAVAVAAPAQAATYYNCYVAMSGRTYCQKACTPTEEMKGCVNGSWWYWNVWGA